MSNEISLEAINDMYRLVNENAQKILDSLTEKDSVKKYLGTLDVNKSNYEKNYRKFYGMNPARLSNDFYTEYFEILLSRKINNEDIENKIDSLFKIVKHLEEFQKTSIHFSFATKLFHTLFTEFPIYDNNIESFFFFEDIEKLKPGQNKNEDEDSYKERVKKIKYAEYKRRYDFLISEYKRVEEGKLLDKAIKLFEKEITFKDISYAKKIDFAIWGFIGLVKDSAILNNKIVYKNERLFTK